MKDEKKLNDIHCLRKRLTPEDIPVFCFVLNITPAKVFEGAIV